MIKNLLKPGGLLIVMTETRKMTEAFDGWYYAKDFTHVSFFHSHTFGYISEKFGLEVVESNNDRVILMQNGVQNEVDS
jgi:hypothetical protein